jgi:hypothetical protein
VSGSTSCAAVNASLTGRALLRSPDLESPTAAQVARTTLGTAVALTLKDPAPSPTSGTVIAFSHNVSMTVNNTLLVALGATSVDSTLCLWLSFQLRYFQDVAQNGSRRLRPVTDTEAADARTTVLTGTPLTLSLPLQGQSSLLQFCFSFSVVGLDVQALAASTASGASLRDRLAREVRTL